MQVVWEDITTYSRTDKERIPSTWELKLPSGLRICITNGHIHYRGTWVFHCHALGFNTIALKATSKEQAEKQSIEIVSNRVCKFYDDLSVLT